MGSINLDRLTTYIEDEANAGSAEGFYMLGIRQDAGGSPVSADGDFHPFVFNDDGELKVNADITMNTVPDDDPDSGDPLKVGSRAVTGALTAVSANNDRADLLSDDFRRIWINDSPNISAEATAVTVATTATSLPATPLTGRRRMIIQNQGNNSVWVGDTGVTTATGVELGRRSSMSLEVGDDVVIQAIVTSGTENVRVLELA